MSATERSQMPRLNDEQLREILELSRGADTFELKLTIPEQERYQTLTALGVDPLEAHIRQVFFFDTPGLDLDSAGVVVRGRRTQERPDDSVVKLRPVDPAKLDDEQRAAEGFGVEVDAMPGGFVCSASFKGKLSKPHVKAAAAGEAPISKLFSKGQRDFFSKQAPDGIELDDLAVLGPVTVFKIKQPPGELGRKLVIELWNYPDGTRILELSTKCMPNEAFQVAAETRGYLTERGIDLSGEQTTKTRTALEYFAGQLNG
jgi:hypothetical protein